MTAPLVEDAERWLCVAEAAKTLGLTRMYVAELARRGRLQGYVDGCRGWRLSEQSVLEYLHRPRPVSERTWLVPVRSSPGTVPAEPLLRLVDARGGRMGCGIAPRSAEERAIQRARRSGLLTEAAADNLATRVLGLHPLEIWGA